METSRDDALTYESRLYPTGNIVGFHEDMVRRECEKRNKRQSEAFESLKKATISFKNMVPSFVFGKW